MACAAATRWRGSASLVGVWVCLHVLAPGEALAQSRGFVGVNGAFQLTATDFSERIESTFNAETAVENRSYEVDTGTVIDLNAGVFVWRNLAVGGGLSSFSKSGDVSISGSVPHPFFFNRSRSITGSASNLSREELVIYAQAIWSVPVNDKVNIAVFGGPAFFNVKQDLVTETFINDPFPFASSPTVTSVELTELSESTVGFHAGADVAVYFSRHVGIGTLVRFSRATVSLPSDGNSINVDVGGIHVGVGLRLRF